MTDETPRFEYTLPGSGVRLYANRIESWRRGLLTTKRTVVLLRTVTSVDKTAAGRVVVTTNDGKRHEYVAGFQTEALREAILRAL